MMKINSFTSVMPNNIYLDKKNINNKNNSSEKLKVVGDEVSFKDFNQKIDEGKFEKIETGILSGVIEGETLYENTLQPIDRFLVNLTNSYSKEKAKIESSLTGKEKDIELKYLNTRFDNTVIDYSDHFSLKSYYTYGTHNEDLIKGVENICQKAKEYIDNGNKAPTNMEEYKKFSDYVSQNPTNDSNHISLSDLSKFDKIAVNMSSDLSDFEGINQFIDKTDLPENLKNILKINNYMKVNDPLKEIRALTHGASLKEVLKESNERKKYFDNLLYSKTEQQEKSENDTNNITDELILKALNSLNTENSQNDELMNKMLDSLNDENRLNDSIFSGLKTGSEKYSEFIKQNKYHTSSYINNN